MDSRRYSTRVRRVLADELTSLTHSVTHRHEAWRQVGDLASGHHREVGFLNLDVQEAERVHAILQDRPSTLDEG